VNGLVQNLPYLLAAWLFLVGLYGIVSSDNYIHMIMCLSVVQSSTYVLILQVGYLVRGTAPIFYDVHPGARAVDPVVQSLVLTDIVVGVVVTALLLALVLQAHKLTGTLDPGDLHAMQG
jgi:multicomponent Na+:H+ antiporter subunit C